MIYNHFFIINIDLPVVFQMVVVLSLLSGQIVQNYQNQQWHQGGL